MNELPGLKECIELMDEIEGGKMEKPKTAWIGEVKDGQYRSTQVEPEQEKKADPPLMDDPIDEVLSLLAALEARYRKIQAQSEAFRDHLRKVLEGLQ